MALVAVTSLFLWAGLLSAAGAINSLCFDKISTLGGLYLQEHPARGKAVVAFQDGTMKLVTLPKAGSSKAAQELSTWLDLKSLVFYTGSKGITLGEGGLLSFAFHPNFLSNGRFFVSFTCDSNIHWNCRGPCNCDGRAGCVQNRYGFKACNFHSIVAEFWAGPNPAGATAVQPRIVRQIINVGRPFGNHNGGHIFFDQHGYLFYTSGDGGSEGDPFNLAQQPHTPFGKVLRIDVNHIPPGRPYGVPPSNPWANNPAFFPGVYALGFRNPWRCDIDPKSKLTLCADVGQDAEEEINKLESGGNYQWRIREGNQMFGGGGYGPGTLISPRIKYTHNSCNGKGLCAIDTPAGIACIGGVFYRAKMNKCLRGRFLFSDAYGPMWVTSARSPKNAAQVQYQCAPTSPITCKRNVRPFGVIYSWARDMAGNAYACTQTGIYRVANQNKCGVFC